MKNLYLLPLLSLLGLAGCSNSPAPDAYIPPSVPAIEVQPTPVPESGGVIDTDKFIAQGEQYRGNETRPSTELDRLIRKTMGLDSMSAVARLTLTGIDNARTTLAASEWQARTSRMAAGGAAIAQTTKEDGTMAKEPRYGGGMAQASVMNSNLQKYANTKYDLLAGNISAEIARNNMQVYRSRAIIAAREFDKAAYLLEGQGKARR